MSKDSGIEVTEEAGKEEPGKEGLRQSMAWLHTWLGLLVGWVLFYVYLTGTLGYFDKEIDHWMTPDKPFFSTVPSTPDQLNMAQTRLENVAADANSWTIQLIGGREASSLDVAWVEQAANGERGLRTNKTLSPVSGEVIDNSARETGGGQLLYKMHYNMAYLPLNWANVFIEICSVFMFMAMISGIIVHKKIFKEFFTFRPSKGQRSWLDGHNVLSVTSLPFHLMVTYSGLLFFVYIFMPAGPDFFYRDTPASGGAQLYQGVYGARGPSAVDVGEPSSTMVPLAQLVPMLDEVERVWGVDKVTSVDVLNPGHANARVVFKPLPSESVAAPTYTLIFDGVSGELLEDYPGPYIYPMGKADQVMKGLHKGLFSGPFLRVIYVLMGLAGTAMIGTGLLLWSSKRTSKLLASGQKIHMGIAVVDRLNLGTIIGLPIAIAAYFWANRLLAADMVGRGDWEEHAMYLTLALTFIYPIWRPLERARIEMLWVAAAAYVLLPVVNVLTTQRHLGISLLEGDWVMAGFDLSALACGLVFVVYALKAQRKEMKGASAESDNESTLAELATP